MYTFTIDIYIDCAFMRLNTIIRSLVRAKERLPHCFHPVDKPFPSNSLYSAILSCASLTCAKLGLNAPTNPEVCHVVPPPILNLNKFNNSYNVKQLNIKKIYV